MPYPLTVVLISGPIGSGKTALSEELTQRYDAERISTLALISAVVGRHMSRRDLQGVGTSAPFLGGNWITSKLSEIIEAASGAKSVIIDSVRTLEQINDIRAAAAGQWRVIHAHLTAEERLLAARYQLR